MNNPASRPNMTSIAAACILSGGLIAAAIIDSHKPAPLVVQAPENVPPYALQGQVKIPEPPISQEAVGSQAEAQLLADPKLHDLAYKGGDCRLIAAKTTLVQYDAKADQFSLTFDLTWKAQGTMATSASTSSFTSHVWGGGSKTPPETGSVTLSNDGYGHYFGILDPDRGEQGTPYITVTVR